VGHVYSWLIIVSIDELWGHLFEPLDDTMEVSFERLTCLIIELTSHLVRHP
jgi:hypothetical protein